MISYVADIPTTIILMQIKKFSLGALQTNCYLVWDSGEGVIIDPADTGEFIAEKIHDLKFTPKAVIATHGHFDHILGAGELQMIINAPFFINKNDMSLLEKMNQSASHWLRQSITKPPPNKIQFLKENDLIHCGEVNFRVITTPGHTPGSISLYTKTALRNQKTRSLLFSGDTLFSGAIGRTDFSYSDKKQLDVSLNKLFNLPKQTVVFPGHGEKTIIEQETNEKIFSAFS